MEKLEWMRDWIVRDYAEWDDRLERAAAHRRHLEELIERDMWLADEADADEVAAWRERMRERFPEGISPEVDFEAVALARLRALTK